MSSCQCLSGQCTWCAAFIGDFNHFKAKRRQNVAIGRITRTRDSNTVARIEIDQKCQIKRSRRACGNRNALGRNGYAIALRIMCSNRLTQFDKTKCIGVTDATIFQGAFRSQPHNLRRRVCWLAYCHRNYRMARRTTTIGLRQNIHGVKRFDRASVWKSIQLSLQDAGNAMLLPRPIIAELVKQQRLW